MTERSREHKIWEWFFTLCMNNALIWLVLCKGIVKNSRFTDISVIVRLIQVQRSTYQVPYYRSVYVKTRGVTRCAIW